MPIPVMQAGMGVQVAKAELAGAVCKEGGIGCISSVGLGSLEGSIEDYINDSNVHLVQEIKRAREISPDGVLAVNVMVALSNYAEIVKTCIENKIDIIVSGAGVPLNLPELVGDAPIKLIPVVSSARAAAVILKTWHRRYKRFPDAIVVEGPLCGGHLGFTFDQIDHPTTIPIAQILSEIKAVLAPFEAEYGRKMTLIGAESIVDYDDVIKMLELGFDGVQVGTRFILSEESGIAPVSKEIYVKAKKEDLLVIKSPLGMPLRVIRTPFIERLLAHEKIYFKCPFRCLRACDAKSVKFCLAYAMLQTMHGNINDGIYATGCGIDRCNDIIPAAKFFEPFHNELNKKK